MSSRLDNCRRYDDLLMVACTDPHKGTDVEWGWDGRYYYQRAPAWQGQWTRVKKVHAIPRRLAALAVITKLWRECYADQT